MNILNNIRQEEKRINKKVEQYRRVFQLPSDSNLSDIRKKYEQQEEDEFEYLARKSFRRLLRLKEIGIEEGYYPDDNKIQKTYFITIRPDQSKITFLDFLSEIKKLYKRNCFNKYIITFEQKGTSEDKLGDGFHCHVIAEVKQRSKGELLRDITSSCQHFCAPNCIDVKPLRTEKDVQNIRDYIIEYKSDDGHKIVTKEWDTLWRNKNNLKHLYENVDDICVPAIKSIGQAIVTW